MNQQHCFSALFFILASLFTCQITFAGTYPACDPETTTIILNKFKLLSTETVKYEEPENRSDCILMDANHVLFVTANTIPTKEYHYQMNLYLIDTEKNKIVSQYKHPQTISEENGRFSSIKFDRVSYSNLPKQHVIGLKTHFYNIGEQSFDLDKFNLFRVQYNQNHPEHSTFQWVLRNIVVDLSSSWRPSFGCDTNTSDEIKSIFILQKTQHHQLQDILLKQTKKSEDTGENCKYSHRKQTQQQLLKFNGEFYQFDPKLLLNSDDFKNDE